MNRRHAASFLLASIVALLITQYFWINTSILGSCPEPVSAPAVTVTVTVTVPVPYPTEDVQKELPLQGPRNSTLGFQKIYYISMPQRTDRQDIMTLIGGYLNLEFTRMDGVNGSTIAAKAYPFDPRNPPERSADRKVPIPRTAQVGCWRAHANVWSHMISAGVSSALILEDDADFSVGIRDIMEGVSKQLQDVVGATNGESYGIVDGNSWDILTLGHCGYDIVHPEHNPMAAKKIRVWVDPYAPEGTKFSSFMPDAPSKRLRLLSPSKGSICNQGYAITREGAMRLLYNVGGPGHVLNQPQDNLIKEQLHSGVIKGFLSVPDIIAQWKWQDWRDTDIQLFSEKQLKSFKKGSTADIIGSVREEIMSVFNNRNVWEEIENKEEETVEAEGGEMMVDGEEMEMMDEVPLLDNLTKYRI